MPAGGWLVADAIYKHKHSVRTTFAHFKHTLRRIETSAAGTRFQCERTLRVELRPARVSITKRSKSARRETTQRTPLAATPLAASPLARV